MKPQESGRFKRAEREENWKKEFVDFHTSITPPGDKNRKLSFYTILVINYALCYFTKMLFDN